MLSLNTASNCGAGFLHRCSGQAAQELSHIRKQGEESACPVAFKRLSCSPVIILNKQTICLLSISPAPRFSSPPSPAGRTLQSRCYCGQPSTSIPRPETSPRAASPRHRQTSTPAGCPSLPHPRVLAVHPFQGHPCQRRPFWAYLSWSPKPAAE